MMKALRIRRAGHAGLPATGLALMVIVVIGILIVGSGVAFGGNDQRALRIDAPTLVFASPEDVRLPVHNEGGRLRWTVTSHSGKLVDSGIDEDVPSSVIAPRIENAGYYALEIDNGHDKIAANFLVSGGAPDSPSLFFAVATHWGKQTYVESTWPLAPTVPLVTGLGIDQIRDETTWTSVERVAGEYSVPDFAENLSDAAQANDLHMMFVASYGNPRAYGGDMDGPMSPPTTAEGKNAFVTYINTVLDANPTIDKVEVWNEFNRPRRNTSNCQSGACYADLVKAVWEGVKPEHPSVKIVAGNTAGIPMNWFADFIDAGGLRYTDVISTHGYAANVDDLRNGIRGLDRLIRTHNGGKSKSIIVSEVGLTNTTVSPPLGNVSRVLTAEQAGGGLVKIYATMKSIPAVAQTVWYAALDDGTDPQETEANFGLYRQPSAVVSAFEPKPAAAAMSFFIRHLDGYRFASATSVGADVSVTTFIDEAGDTRRLMWKNAPFASSDTATQSVSITTSAGHRTIVRSYTGEILSERGTGTSDIDVGVTPVYLDEVPVS